MSPTAAYTDRYVAALGDAAARHRAQRRKGSGVPYVAHLLAVGALVWEDGGDEDEAIAALLHDAVEDTGGRPVLDEIGEAYGERVAHLVAACTDAWTQPKPAWRPRKAAHLAELRDEGDPGALRVFAADKVHNAGAIVADAAEVGSAVWQRFTAGRDETLWYYRTAHELLADRLPGSRLTARLGELLDELDAVPG
jgi:(p)ppGpp synthase/HD superfamily hydrolase